MKVREHCSCYISIQMQLHIISVNVLSICSVSASRERHFISGDFVVLCTHVLCWFYTIAWHRAEWLSWTRDIRIHSLPSSNFGRDTSYLDRGFRGFDIRSLQIRESVTTTSCQIASNSLVILPFDDVHWLGHRMLHKNYESFLET
jgi:hypothetical protein